MATLTWRNVDAPNFNSSNDLLNNGIATSNNAIQALQTLVNGIRGQNQNQAANQLAQNLIQYSDPKQLQTSITNGNVYAGVDTNNLTPEAIASITKARTGLNQQASTNLVDQIRQQNLLDAQTRANANQVNTSNLTAAKPAIAQLYGANDINSFNQIYQNNLETLSKLDPKILSNIKEDFLKGQYLGTNAAKLNFEFGNEVTNKAVQEAALPVIQDTINKFDNANDANNYINSLNLPANVKQSVIHGIKSYYPNFLGKDLLSGIPDSVIGSSNVPTLSFAPVNTNTSVQTPSNLKGVYVPSIIGSNDPVVSISVPDSSVVGSGSVSPIQPPLVGLPNPANNVSIPNPTNNIQTINSMLNPKPSVNTKSPPTNTKTIDPLLVQSADTRNRDITQQGPAYDITSLNNDPSIDNATAISSAVDTGLLKNADRGVIANLVSKFTNVGATPSQAIDAIQRSITDNSRNPLNSKFYNTTKITEDGLAVDDNKINSYLDAFKQNPDGTSAAYDNTVINKQKAELDKKLTTLRESQVAAKTRLDKLIYAYQNGTNVGDQLNKAQQDYNNITTNIGLAEASRRSLRR